MKEIMKMTASIKKYIITFIFVVTPVQQLHSSDFKLDTTQTIATTAVISALAYAAYQQLNQPAQKFIPTADSSNITSIIFDLDGVLCATNKLRAFQEIGIPVTLSYMTNQIQLPSEKILFDALSGVPAISTYKSYNKNLQMPQIMIDWQTGAQDLPIIRKSITDHLKNLDLPKTQKSWALESALMMTDPERFIATRQTIPANIALLYELKEKGYKLYILSNWDSTSFPLFQEKFPEIFLYESKEMFDGIMISGLAGIPKPEIAFFKKCLKDFNIKAESTIFIDDEPANITAAQKVGIKTILSNPSDTKILRKNLIELLAS